MFVYTSLYKKGSFIFFYRIPQQAYFTKFLIFESKTKLNMYIFLYFYLLHADSFNSVEFDSLRFYVTKQ